METRIKTAANKTLWKGGIGKPLFVVKILGRLPANLLSTRLIKDVYHNQERKAILTAWLAPKMLLKLFWMG